MVAVVPDTVKYDVVVAGGSIAGLLCAREVASADHSVIVLERDHEIGTPQHCGGLVSRGALEYLGVVPSAGMTGNAITSAKMISPNGTEVVVPSNGKVLEVDRRVLDKRVASQAHDAGADIRPGTTFRGATQDTARTTLGDIRYKILVDARGVASLGPSQDMLQSAQFDVRAQWIKRGQVVVMVDQEKYPGFFGWVIPSGSGRGKVGVAGRGIRAPDVLDSLLDAMGRCSVFRRISVPVWVGGPVESFVRDNTVVAGDAAGQAKPTTAGGIYSSGAGGLLAGRAISRHLDSGETPDYRHEWMVKFGREFEVQRAARRMLERLDNDSIDRLVAGIRPDALRRAGAGDFDFHTGAILGMLGVRGTAGALGTITANEVRRAGERIRALTRRA